MGYCSEFLIKVLFAFKVPAKRFSGYVFGYENAVKIFPDCEGLCNIY